MDRAVCAGGMKVNAEKLEGNKAKLTIEVPPETFEVSMDKSFRKVANRFNIHGFRKGKAPRHIVERMYGREVLLEDAINDAVPPAFSQAVGELGRLYECIVYPQYDIVSSEKGEGLVFTAVYDLKPEVKLGAYKGMELERLKETIEEDAVEKELAAMRERFARLEITEEAAVSGDICTIDYLGKIDDVPFEGGEGVDHPLELGSNTFIPGFEEQLIGAKAGDEVEVKVVFPEDYPAEGLMGKDAVFAVKVKEVKQKILSEMNDEFAKDVSEFETLEELKKDLEERFRKAAKDNAQADFETKAVEKAIEEAEMEIPESMVEFRQDQLLDNFAGQMQRQGLSIDQYLEYTGQKIEDIRENFKERASKELMREFVLEAVAELEGIEINEGDVEAEYQKLAEQTGMPLEDIAKLYTGNPVMLESLRFGMLINQTIKLLAEQAIIKES